MIGIRAHTLPSSGHGVHMQIMTILQQGPSQATAGMIFSIMWCLWKSRNDHRFNNIHWSPARVLHEAKAIDMSYSLAMEEDMNPPDPVMQARHQHLSSQGTIYRADPMQVHDGPRVFCDASVCVQQPPHHNQTGIGVFILSSPRHSLSSGYFFQVAIPRILEPLEAEGWALLLGARLAAALNLQVVNFLTDNEILADAAKRRSSCQYPGHWSLRHIIAEFAEITEGMQHPIIKINRDTNKMADRLAKQARQATISSSCLFSCEANVHSTQCTVQTALQNFDWGMFCPISVLCL